MFVARTGATIGQLDQEAIFYLQSRGIAKEQARDLLMHAFARDIVDRVKVGSLRARLEQILAERLHARRNWPRCDRHPQGIPNSRAAGAWQAAHLS